MCLSDKHDWYPKNANRKRVGYKVYSPKNEDGTYGYMFGYLKPRKWYNAQELAEANPQEGLTGEGFHIIKASQLKKAIKEVKDSEGCDILCKVEYRGVKYSGEQYDMECVVATDMRIVCEVVDKNGRIRKQRQKVKA